MAPEGPQGGVSLPWGYGGEAGLGLRVWRGVGGNDGRASLLPFPLR